MWTVEREVGVNAVAAIYPEMQKLSVIFNHAVIADNHGTWRWKPNQLMRWIFYEGDKLDLNQMWLHLFAGTFSVEELMKFEMQTGGSLGYFEDSFSQHEISEVAGAPDVVDPSENLIDYVLRIHNGRVLSL